MGYESASHKDWVDESGRKNVRFYLNTGAGPDHFCRKSHQSLISILLVSSAMSLI